MTFRSIKKASADKAQPMPLYFTRTPL